MSHIPLNNSTSNLQASREASSLSPPFQPHHSTTYFRFSFILSILTLMTSTFFWFWAMENTRERHAWKEMSKQDLGIYSFLTVMMTSSLTLYSLGTSSTNWENNLNSKSHIPVYLPTLSLLSHLLVTINYALVPLLYFSGKSESSNFLWYCVIFTCLWFGLALWSFRVLSFGRKRKESERGGSDSEEEGAV